ncbi:hypothetical protein [Spongiibacter tropicus]|uniref:hypothetical protein n=1 Tax=Spongiibacter tropicus TaxID=454602 RepID=UPI0003B650F7|nr:hypothetical protein [Spongiibacter tropicus]
MKTNKQIADRYRKERCRDLSLTGGVIHIFNGEACGWMDKVRDPHTAMPGSILVDEQGNEWVATGGDDYNGATAWEAVTKTEKAS